METFLDWAAQLLHIVRQHDYLALYLLLAVEEGGVPLPLPGDTVVAYAGHLAQLGQMIWWLILLIATAASVSGSLPLYWLTRSKGRPLLKRYGKYIHLTPARERRIEGWLQRHGGPAVFVGRLIPGFRVGTTAVAGVFEIPFWQFFLYMTLAALTWWGFWLWIGYALGKHIAPMMEISPVHLVIALATVAAAAAAVLYLRYRERRQRREASLELIPDTVAEVRVHSGSNALN